MSDYGLKIMFIPDTQQKVGVPNAYLTWIGEYLVDKKPDVVVHIGDHWDMPSLSSYDYGKKCYEGRTYKQDIDAGNLAMDLLMQPLIDYNRQQAKTKHRQYKPRLVFCIGNHENRITRAIDDDRKLDGTLGFHNFNLAKHGWEVHDFLEIVNINGVRFSHYFYRPLSGTPYTGMAETRLKNIGFSFVMGHQQVKVVGELRMADGSVRRALVCGTCYLHNEKYRGPQGNEDWRGFFMLQEVKDGNYDLMEVSLDFLRRRRNRIKGKE